MSQYKTIAQARSEPPGWYGKLPTLGDFASRRLAVDFIEPWDDWLAHGIADWRAAESDAWLDAYLQAPTWRFVLPTGVLPGPCGRSAWAGVVMPSVDRVGRYFPFTVAQQLDALPADARETERLLRWLQGLEDLAVDALHDDWNVEQLEAALEAAGRWPAASPLPEGTETLASGIDLLAHGTGRSLWLRTGDDGRTHLSVEPGLPAGLGFRTLLAGRACAAPGFATRSHPLP